jgi:hypothetical protein
VTRWIVNPSSQTVRSYWTPATAHLVPAATLEPGEFIYDAPTLADASAAGRRHMLAQEALRTCGPKRADFIVLADRIVCKLGGPSAHVDTIVSDMHALLCTMGYDVWREGFALLVLDGPKGRAR